MRVAAEVLREEDAVICDSCNAETVQEEWIESGINAMAGRLMRDGVFVEENQRLVGKESNLHHSYSVNMNKTGYRGPFDSFEEAVLDTYNHLMGER